MSKRVRRYVAVFEPDEEPGWWVATIDEEGVVTQGKSLRQTRRRLREALAAALDDEKAAEVADIAEDHGEVGKLAAAVAECTERRDEAAAALEEAQLEAVRGMTARGLSYRDCADLLGLSHQRVHQLRERLEAAE